MSNIKFSIFTPTHKLDYIDDLYKSLINQDYKNWEWLILANGDNVDQLYNDLLNKYNDSNIYIYKASPSVYTKIDYYIKDGKKILYENKDAVNTNGFINVASIGALKNEICSKAMGDYLVEVDHDDILLDTALEELHTEILKSNPDFIYSDFCNFFDKTWESSTYSSVYGWDNYEFIYKDKTLVATSAIDISPRALYQIFYTPNHIRVWRKKFYDSIGGHDKQMIVCDDHDLVCRTYLNNAKMVKIPKPLYLYRLQENETNSYLQYNNLIQIKQQEVGNKYFYKMVDKWCNDNNLKKIDLGGAFNKPEGYLSVDLLDIADIQCDVTNGIPLPDNSVGIVRAYDFLEHITREKYYLDTTDDGVSLTKTNAFIDLMNEIYRVLAPDGWLLSATPSSNTKAAAQDPTHVNPVNTNTFWYFTDDNYKQYVPDIKCRFQATRVWENMIDNDNNIGYTLADLLCLKGQKVVGLVKC